MGKKHREKRKRVKAQMRRLGWYENEYGELKKRTTKAEARRKLLWRWEFEGAVIQKCNEQISLDIDREIIAELTVMDLAAALAGLNIDNLAHI